MTYEMNQDGSYKDLEFTNFPAKIDSWEDSEDVSSDYLDAANNYKAALAKGNYATAQNILLSTPKLKNMLIGAKDINELKHAVMAIERFYTEDVKSFITDYSNEAKENAQKATTAASSAMNSMAAVEEKAQEANDSQIAAKQEATKAAEHAEASSNSARAAAASEANANTSQTAAKASEAAAAGHLQATKEYFEQVRTITIGAQGWYATPEALKVAVPVGENGWWAVVGTTDTIWTWDSDTGTWKDSAQTADLSDYYTRAQVDNKLSDYMNEMPSKFVTHGVFNSALEDFLRCGYLGEVDPGVGSNLPTGCLGIVYQ